MNIVIHASKIFTSSMSPEGLSLGVGLVTREMT